MRILSLDPGTNQSGFCLLQGETVLESGVFDNPTMRVYLKATEADFLAIEMIASYGMPVGKETFETVLWIGRFMEAWGNDDQVQLIYRKDVKSFLCGSMKAKDANIRQALIDKLGPVGTAKNKGPLYGVKSHAWSALAVGITAAAKAAL